MIAELVKWALRVFVGSKITLAFYGGIALCIVAGVFGFYQWGQNVAEGRCEAAALRTERDALIIDRDAANERAARAGAIVAALNELRHVSEQEIARLSKELADAKLQSTQPGAKHDPASLLDDNCNYTDRGVSRRLRK